MEFDKFMEIIAKNDFSIDDSKLAGISLFGSERDLKAGVEIIEPDEMPIGIAGGEFFYGDRPGDDNHTAVIILTDRRIIKADKKIKNTDYTIFHGDDIKSSSFKTSFLSSTLTISTTAGVISLTKVRKETAKKFNSELHKLIGEFKKSSKGGNTTINQAASGMDEIKKAKELLDSGIIDQSEFDAIKKKFL